MRNIYGTRSIIPNNYYFTFDKIYPSGTKPNNEDSVLIGRCVLWERDNTVWLKTVQGYIRVAKLDNEGRFTYLEGHMLQQGEDINNLNSHGNTPHNDGTYIVDFNFVNGTEENLFVLDDETNKYVNIIGTWPHIRGQQDKDYWKGNTFLLQQYSSAVKNLKPKNLTQDDVYRVDVEYYEVTTKEDGTEEYKKIILTANDFETRKSTNELSFLCVYEPDGDSAEILITQIMTDITKDVSKDKNTARENLYHHNKTFIRKRNAIFKPEEYDGSQNRDYYFFDRGSRKFYSVDSPETGLTYYYIDTSENQSKWSDWKDTSEQYTGYIGDLDPLLIENKKSSNNNNLNTSSNLVEALNTHDKIIGSDSRINKNGIVNNIEYGSLSSNLSDDYRNYNIPEDNIMDAIVHHDADIGAIEDLKAGNDPVTTGITNNTNNLQFTTNSTQTENTISSVGNIQSLTQAIQLLDKIIGAYRRFGDGVVRTGDLSLIHTIDDDVRPTSLNGQNIIDALLYHDADIGSLSRLTDINNINFNKTNSNINVNSNDVEVDSLNKDVTSTKSNINSLVDAILVLNTLIGNGTLLDKYKKNEDGTHQGIDANNIIDALLEHDKEIGEIEDLTNDNNKINKNNLVQVVNRLNSLMGVLNDFNDVTKTTTNIDWADDEDSSTITSLVDVIIKLDKIIGDFNKSSIGNKIKDENENYDGSSTGTYANTIVGAISEHDSEIGELDWFNDENNAPNITYGEQDGEIKSLVDAIILLDNLLGNFSSLSEINSLNDYSNIIEIINFINEDCIGKCNTFTNKNNNHETSLLFNIVETLDNIIGKKESLPKEDLISAILNNRKHIENNQDNITKNREDIDNIITNILQINEDNKSQSLEDLRKLINTMSYNMDIMDTTIADLASQANLGESSGSLKWGTF